MIGTFVIKRCVRFPEVGAGPHLVEIFGGLDTARSELITEAYRPAV